MKLSLLVCQLLFGLLLLRDISHHRHRTAGGCPATVDSIASTVRRDVLEALAGRMAQTFYAPRDQRLHVTFAVIAMHRKVAQKFRIGLAGPKQVGGDWIHFPEAVVAEDDIQILIGVDERPGHVVQCQVKLGFLARQLLLSLLLWGDIGHHRHRAARGRPATMDAIASAVWRDVLETLAGRMAQTFHAPRDHHVHVAFAVVAMASQGGAGTADRVGPVEAIRRGLGTSP